MKAFAALLARDVRLALRQGGDILTAVGFYLIVVTVLPLGLGPDLNLLARIAPGVLWVALLLSALLALDRMFQGDHEDGALDALALGPLPLELVAAAKALAHWLTTAVPLALAAPVLGLLLNLPAAGHGALLLTVLAGTPAVSFIGAVGAALTLDVKRGGLLVPLLVLPLNVPVLIFGIGAMNAAMGAPAPFLPPFLILTAISLAAVVTAPWAAAAALRLNLA